MDGPPPPYSRLINEESPEEPYSQTVLTSPQDTPPNPPSYEYSETQGSNSSSQLPVHQYSTSLGSNEHTSRRNTGEHSRPDVVVQRSLLVLVVNAESQRQTKSYCRHILFSCLVIWLCGIYGGIRAFVYAIKARKLAQQGRDLEAEVYGQASIRNSITGIVVGIIFIALLVGVILFVTKGSGGSDTSSGSHSSTVATANNIFFQEFDGSCCFRNDDPCTYYRYKDTYYTC